MPPPYFLSPAALACALLTLPACARMVETRTETIVARERGSKVDAWHPERDHINVAVHIEGDALLASVHRSRACTLAIGERRRIATHVEASADSTVLVLEGAGAAALMAMGAAIGNNAKSSQSTDTSDAPDLSALGAIPFAIGAALGVGFVIDLTAGGEETTERTEIVQTGVQESPECDIRPAEGAVVAFAIHDGPSVSCRAATDGSCRVAVDPSLWDASGGTLNVDVSVDGRLLRHEQLRRMP